MLHGVPGSGKSDASVQIGAALGIPKDRILVVHVNNHDVVDFTGVPSVVDGQTKFNPTDMFYQFRDGTGAGLIVLEELAQSSHHHQTWAAGFVLERETPTFKLDPQVRILATGNRAEDRSGAKAPTRSPQRQVIPYRHRNVSRRLVRVGYGQRRQPTGYCVLATTPRVTQRL